MIHHSCSYRENDMDGILGNFKRMETAAGVGEDGHLRCCACGRKVCLPDGTTEVEDGPENGLAVVESPYPDGWCSDRPEIATATPEEVLSRGV